jgi:ParB family chromosome partitioning protein
MSKRPLSHARACQAEAKPAVPRTGVGMLSRMLSGAAADTEAVSKLNAEIEKLKLQVGEQLIDPRQIALTRWADRHPDSFSSQAFMELKQEIESAGGNVQPIKVRPVRGAAAEQPEGPRFELVYGSRRTRACLELGLPVRAVVDENVDDQALYVQMQRENRGRSNLSAWEQGVSYHKALNEGLFPSARRLAEQIGLDHSNVAKALRVAELPQEIVGAFRSPVDIQFRWAVALDKAYQQDPDAVLVGCPVARRPVAEARLPQRCSAR